MAISSTDSIFTSDTYTPSSYQSQDPLSSAVGKTQLSPPSSLIQSSNQPTANTVDSKASSAAPQAVSTGSAAGAKGAVKSLIVAAKFMIDLNNAQSAYRATTAEIRNNMMLSRLNEDDAMSQGRQKILDRKVEGQNASNAAAAHLAAQGLDVSSHGAQNVIKAYEAIGIQNAAREEQNMYREAFKFDVEQAQLEYAKDMAAVNLKTQQLNSTLDFIFGQMDAASTAAPVFA